MIAQYMVVADEAVFGLEPKVNDLILEDWQPFGGLCYALGRFFQVMVRYAE